VYNVLPEGGGRNTTECIHAVLSIVLYVFLYCVGYFVK
jgi:hypothetical protein